MTIDPSTSAHYTGDCRELLRRLPDACVQTCVTSPPYWGLRDYGHPGQIGLEETPAAFVAVMVDVFREVRRVLHDDGTLWLNLGDSYAQGVRGGIGDASGLRGSRDNQNESRRAIESRPSGRKVPDGYKSKDLLGMPWRVAFALQADGWYLRSDIIWHKPNPMPESTTDRPTKAHEYLFLLAKSERYYYDADAIREPCIGTTAHDRTGGRYAPPGQAPHSSYRAGNKRRALRGDRGGNPAHQSRKAMGVPWEDEDGLRSKRSVWTVQSMPYSGAHFATFPPKLIEPCILAGSRPGDLVLDPFFGSGTTGEVAEKHERRWIGFDLGYEGLAKARTAQRTLGLARSKP